MKLLKVSTFPMAAAKRQVMLKIKKLREAHTNCSDLYLLAAIARAMLRAPS